LYKTEVEGGRKNREKGRGGRTGNLTTKGDGKEIFSKETRENGRSLSNKKGYADTMGRARPAHPSKGKKNRQGI